MLGLAVALDLLFGEPSNRFHPVAWMGRAIEGLLARSPQAGNARQLAYGALIVTALLALFLLPAWAALEWLQSYSTAGYVLAGALVLKTSFSIRALWSSAAGVRSALAAADLPAARQELGQLVSRDTAALTAPQVAAAAIESTAENFTDSVAAPLFYFVLFGPLGALGYRVVNTLDAMVGYHGRYEYLGKAAARLDDLLNLIPARTSGLLLTVCAAAGRGSVARAWRTMWRDHSVTESPNAGWTMSAMAGALSVRLEKVGFYQLGANYPEPTTRDVERSLRLQSVAVGMAVLLTALGTVGLYV